MCWRERELSLVLSARSALAEMVILFVIIIRKQNKFLDDITVVICRNMQDVVVLHDSEVMVMKVAL